MIRRYNWFKPRHFLLIGHFGIVLSQKRWIRLIPKAFHVSFQLLNFNDVIKHISGVKITIQFELDRFMLRFSHC
ncbi:hypothetical protein Hanom_Chr02g00111721 [Helianthus anomalus]